MSDKIKLTKEEFNNMYEVEEITGEIEDKPQAPSTQSFNEEIPDKQDTTPEFLTEEEAVMQKEYDEALPEIEE